MNSSAVLFVISCIIAVALACSNCGPPQDPAVPCGAPDCTLPENQQNNALFPHPDPNFYYQCYPHSIELGWIPIVRSCACGTVFNPHISPRRCTFWWESTWYPICEWESPPNLAPCPTWCPDCEGGNGQTTSTPELPGGGEPTTTNGGGEGDTTTNGGGGDTTTNGGGGGDTTTPGSNNPVETTTDNNNQCPDLPPCIPCSPCIWWPCWPCDPCWCNNISINNSRNPMSRPQYY